MTDIAWRGSGFGTQVRVLTGRSVRAAFADRSLVFFSLLQPVVLLLLFSQVFDGIGRLPEVARYGAYIDFLMPSTLVNIALTTAMSSGAALLTESYTGFVSRLRGMPVSLLSVLLARTLADTARLAVQLVVTLLAGVVLLGFSPGGGLLGTVAAVLLTLVVGWGLSWVFLAVATMARRPETLQTVSFIAVFPLMFSSTAYMPPDVLPAWVRALSTVNPLTYAIDAVRSLSLGHPVGAAVWLALALTAVATLVGAALATTNFRRNSF